MASSTHPTHQATADRFRERATTASLRPILTDGSMAATLFAAGLTDKPVERYNLTNPIAVEQFEALLASLEAVTQGAARVAGTARELAALEEQQPALLRFYAWCRNPEDLFAGMVLKSWLSLAEVSAETKHLSKSFKLPSVLVPIGKHPDGQHVCIQRYGGFVVVWDHESKEERVIFKTFEALLAKLKTEAARAAKSKSKSKSKSNSK